MRGFKIAKGFENTPISLPKRSTIHSAGYDLEVCETLTIHPQSIALAKTGLKAFMQPDEVLQIVPRSSLPKNYGITIPNNVGIIDSDYYENPDNDGAIFIQLYNFSTKPQTIKAGTRIAQGIFTRYLKATNESPITQKRNGGFGSTG